VLAAAVASGDGITRNAPAETAPEDACNMLYNPLHPPGRSVVSAARCIRIGSRPSYVWRASRSRCRIAAALSKHGFVVGDRLAMSPPNEPEYIELVYACSWLGVVAVPLNTRTIARRNRSHSCCGKPRGLIRHSSLPEPNVRLPWQIVLDKEPLEVTSQSGPDTIYDPEAVMALVYTSGTTGRPKGVVLTHANVLANVHFLNYWMPTRKAGSISTRTDVSHCGFSALVRGTSVRVPARLRFLDSAAGFLQDGRTRTCHPHGPGPDDDHSLAQFSELNQYDLTSLERIAYRGISHRT